MAKLRSEQMRSEEIRSEHGARSTEIHGCYRRLLLHSCHAGFHSIVEHKYSQHLEAFYVYTY